jgi:hypothetical protein
MMSLIFKPFGLSATASRIEIVRSADCTLGFGSLFYAGGADVGLRVFATMSI